jgi:hypothetical protein
MHWYITRSSGTVGTDKDVVLSKNIYGEKYSTSSTVRNSMVHSSRIKKVTKLVKHPVLPKMLKRKEKIEEEKRRKDS